MHSLTEYMENLTYPLCQELVYDHCAGKATVHPVEHRWRHTRQLLLPCERLVSTSISGVNLPAK